jgi:uncharacterized protein (TIGR02996 family)
MEETLLRAIHQAPADPVAWLALADWLEEQGDPRAELLRLHQALRHQPEGPKRDEAQARIGELLASWVRPCVPRLTNSIGLELVLIPAGQFVMGSPADEEERHDDEEQHEVEITRPFYLGAFQVTQAQYEQVVGRNPSAFSAGGAQQQRVVRRQTRSFPVESVSWDDAVTFCKKLSALPAEKWAGRVYRLPTEAEWEYACRAWLTGAPYHFGATLSGAQANINGRNPYPPERTDLRGPNLTRTCKVGSYPPNAWGLYDMHGNVWEWCADWYSQLPHCPGVNWDPQGPNGGHERVFRGGSWYCFARNCRAANRRTYGGPPGPNMIGFRVACGWAG